MRTTGLAASLLGTSIQNLSREGKQLGIALVGKRVGIVRSSPGSSPNPSLVLQFGVVWFSPFDDRCMLWKIQSYSVHPPKNIKTKTTLLSLGTRICSAQVKRKAQAMRHELAVHSVPPVWSCLGLDVFEHSRILEVYVRVLQGD